MRTILSHQLREQAGSNSYNRFEYQVHWIVYHMINEFKKKSEFLIFCEYHDDMAKVTNSLNPECAEFYQIKTTEKYSEWTLNRLTNTTKKRGGGIKHSFIGFIFYNFLQFENECSKCHFVSNIGMDSTILKWQSIIEDGKLLKIEDKAIYDEIKTMVLVEYSDMESDKFEIAFDRFVQNTFVYDGELSLDNYEKVVAGEFLTMLENEDLYTSNCNLILKDIIETVRKKSKAKIDIPISLAKLREKKGVSSEIFNRIKNSVKKISNAKNYEVFKTFLIENNISLTKVNLLLRILRQHHQKLLEIDNMLYQDLIYGIVQIIDETLLAEFSSLSKLEHVLDEFKKRYRLSNNQDNELINEALLEAIFYERILSEDTAI